VTGKLVTTPPPICCMTVRPKGSVRICGLPINAFVAVLIS